MPCRTLADEGSPVTLASNWIKETATFFAESNLRAKLWTLKEWEKDIDIDLVWVVKVSELSHADKPFVKYFSNPENLAKVQVLSTWADEAHVFGRSDTSHQNIFLRQFTRQSQFNVLITGTLFPLGPSQDAAKVLESMGGPFDEPLWKRQRELRRSFTRIFDLDRKLRQTPLLPLRVLIAPFILRRMVTSTWEGEYVIKRKYARPAAKVIVPEADDFASDAVVQFKRSKKGAKTGKESEAQQQERADRMRLYAWSPLYQTYRETLDQMEVAAKKKTKGKKRTINKQAVMEQVIKDGLAGQDFAKTARMKTLIALIKKIKTKGERFLIVSDRIFPLTLIYWVLAQTDGI
jgi:hypothetical protein